MCHVWRILLRKPRCRAINFMLKILNENNRFLICLFGSVGQLGHRIVTNLLLFFIEERMPMYMTVFLSHLLALLSDFSEATKRIQKQSIRWKKKFLSGWKSLMRLWHLWKRMILMKNDGRLKKSNLWQSMILVWMM